MIFITSMSAEGYKEYGKRFLDSFREKVKQPLVVYSEDDLKENRFPVYDLRTIQALAKFLEDCPPPHPFYQWQAGKFAHKVFAITDPYLPETDWRIWIDADVIVDKPFDEKFFETVCNPNYDGSYLGRIDWHTSECGLVAYNMKAAGREFLERLREVYTSGEIFDHLEWHDSYLFDRVMEEGYHFFNLSEGVSGMHVWDDCILGEYSRHMKGVLRKQGKNGNVPESYWSKRERA